MTEETTRPREGGAPQARQLSRTSRHGGGPRLGLRHPGLLCHPGQARRSTQPRWEPGVLCPGGKGWPPLSGQGSCQGSPEGPCGQPTWMLGAGGAPLGPASLRRPPCTWVSVPGFPCQLFQGSPGSGPWSPGCSWGPGQARLVLSQCYSNDHKSRAAGPYPEGQWGLGASCVQRLERGLPLLQDAREWTPAPPRAQRDQAHGEAWS